MRVANSVTIKLDTLFKDDKTLVVEECKNTNHPRQLIGKLEI